MNSAEATINGWHDFYFMTGTMAATLLGLYFVALTIREDIRKEGRGSQIRSATATSFSSLITVALFAMYFLIPEVSAESLGVSITITSVVTVGILIRRLRSMHEAISEIDGHHLRLHLLPLGCHALALAVAMSLVFGSTEWLALLVPSVAVLLISPTRNARQLVFNDQSDG